MTIFRTSNGRGCGLRNDSRILKEEFVMEFLGELITNESASSRSDMYLFDLDFNDDRNALYTVNAQHFGNASHFINHSVR